MKAAVLFLVDMREQEVLFYQNVNTIVDLNPVFAEPSMTPFVWKREAGSDRCSVRNGQKKEVGILERRTVQDTNVVDIVKPLEETYWQCSVTREFDQGEQIRVDGSWSGVVEEKRISKQVTTYSFKVGGEIVASGECRNARDVKLSVDAPTEDPLDCVLVLLALRMFC
jgi:hypothetical protein